MSGNKLMSGNKQVKNLAKLLNETDLTDSEKVHQLNEKMKKKFETTEVIPKEFLEKAHEDYDTARSHIRHLLEICTELIEYSIDKIKNDGEDYTQSYNNMSVLIKTTAETAKNLVSLSKIISGIDIIEKKESEQSSQEFSGTASDLDKMITETIKKQNQD